MVWLVLLGNMYRNWIKRCLLWGSLVAVGWWRWMWHLGARLLHHSEPCSLLLWCNAAWGGFGAQPGSCLAASGTWLLAGLLQFVPALRGAYSWRWGTGIAVGDCSFASSLVRPCISCLSVGVLPVPPQSRRVELCQRLCRGCRGQPLPVLLTMAGSWFYRSLSFDRIWEGSKFFCISLVIAAAENCWPLH